MNRTAPFSDCPLAADSGDLAPCEAYRHQEAMLRAIVEHTSDAIFIKDGDGRYLMLNAACAELFGTTTDAAVGRTDVDFFAPDTVRSLRERDAAVLASGDRHTFEQEVTFADGSVRHYLSLKYPYRDEAGAILGLIGIDRDITERKAMETRLVQLNLQHALRSDVSSAVARGGPLKPMLEACLEAVVHHLGATFARIWLANPDERMLEWKASGGRVPNPTSSLRVPYGGLAVGRIAETHEPFLTNDAQNEPRLSFIRERMVAAGMTSFAGHPLLVGDRLVGVMAMFSSQPMAPHTLEVLGAVADLIAQGIERKRLEVELRRQNEQLKALDTMKSVFVSSVSHELRTPLTSILGFAEFLDDQIDGPLTDGQAQYVGQIQHNTRRLQRLVDDLLDFARLESGTFKLNRQESDLALVVEELVESLRPQLESRRLAWSLQLPDRPIRAMLDPARMEQVLGNLIGNAIKFSPEAGALTIALTTNCGQAKVSVTDTGIGLSPEDQARVFDRFFQADAGLTRTAGGTGLGLSIAKALVEAHDGEIGVESAPGAGATFWFTLPFIEV